jgi:iron complex outermembrane receptor protein
MKRILFLVSLGSSLTIFGQEKTDTTDLLPVEVKAIRAAPTAPFAKTNIGKKDIERQNLGQDLPFLLNQTPSVVVDANAGNGVGYTGIRIRGTDASRINITLNGIPYNDAESQGTFFVDLPDFASSVNTIQIQRGVGTSSNGAGAFGATINFSSNEVNKKAYAESNNSYGSFNTWKNTIKAGSGLIGNHFTADLRMSRISSDGYVDRASSDLRSVYFSTAYLSDKTSIRLNIFSGREKTYQAWYGVSESDLQTNRRINYAGMEKPGEPYDNETDNYRQDHYQLFFTQRFTPRLNFNTAVFLTRGRGYYEEYRAGQDYAAYGLSYPVTGSDTIHTTDLVRRLWLDNYFYGSIFSLQYQSSKTQLTFGGAATRYEGEHFGDVIWAEQGWPGNKRWYDLDAFKNDLNFFAKWQQDLSPAFRFFTDLQFRGVQYHLNGFENNPNLLLRKDYSFFNPKFGFSYHLNHWLAYASLSLAGKEPNRDDFEAGLQQQPRPEHLHDWELGIENKNSKKSWSANLYYMKYRDQLVLTGKINDVGAYTRTNIPDSYRLGLELQGGTTISKWIAASGNLTLSRNRILHFTEYIDDYDNGGQKSLEHREADIAFSPAVIGAATITIKPLKSLDIDLLSKYVGKQYLDNTSNDSRKLNAYFTEDVRAIYSFDWRWLQKVDLIFQVNNVFNKKYEPNGYTFSYYYNAKLTTENYYFPMAGTNWMLGINIKL